MFRSQQLIARKAHFTFVVLLFASDAQQDLAVKLGWRHNCMSLKSVLIYAGGPIVHPAKTIFRALSALGLTIHTYHISHVHGCLDI